MSESQEQSDAVKEWVHNIELEIADSNSLLKAKKIKHY